jgi:hypothetical protein
MLKPVLLASLVQIAFSCNCAPLASCVVFSNGSWGCVCPYHGDGYSVCVEERYVTDVVVRSSNDIKPWLNIFSKAKVASMISRKLLSQTQFVLEFDSTNYEAMNELTTQINEKNWPYNVAVLGSASSRLVYGNKIEEKTPLLEIVNITYSHPFWELYLVANDGLLFLASENTPIPCIHSLAQCCAKEFGKQPFQVGMLDYSKLNSCILSQTNVSQNLRNDLRVLQSKVIINFDGTFSLLLHESELSLYSKTDSNFSNFSVGLLKTSSTDTMATQIYVSLQKRSTFFTYTVGNFTRQVTSYILMQVEQIGDQKYIRCWARVTLNNASVVFVQYAWRNMDWIIPNCTIANQSCIANLNPCTAQVKDNWLELWVPITNHSLNKGNLSLYFVLQANNNLARVMTQSKPDVMQSHCSNLTVMEHVEVEIFQGLQVRQIYKGCVVPNIPLNIEPNVDTLVTIVTRSHRDAMIEEMQAIHAKTDEEKQKVENNEVCDTCVVEQLVLKGRAVSPRSCFVFGEGNATLWIENYVGLPGSQLALDVFSKLPIDLQTGDSGGVWINPVWPYKTDEVVSANTYVYMKFYYPRAATHNSRRLLSFSEEEHVTNSQQRLGVKSTWILIAAIAFFLFLVTVFQAISGY